MSSINAATSRRGVQIFVCAGILVLGGCVASQDLGQSAPATESPDASADAAPSEPPSDLGAPDAGSVEGTAPSEPSFVLEAVAWADDDTVRRRVSIDLGDPQTSKLTCYHDGKYVKIAGRDANWAISFSVLIDVPPKIPATLTRGSFPNNVGDTKIDHGAESYQFPSAGFTIRLTSYTPDRMTGTISGDLNGNWFEGGRGIGLHLEKIEATFDLPIAPAPPPR